MKQWPSASFLRARPLAPIVNLFRGAIAQLLRTPTSQPEPVVDAGQIERNSKQRRLQELALHGDVGLSSS
jgi:hypothetical protein